MIRQFHAPYWDWEDHDAGMYGAPLDLESEMLQSAVLLANPRRLLAAMTRVTVEWPTVTRHHFTNPDENRRAWLGQAACRIQVGSTAAATRAAWGRLADNQRAEANDVAEETIREWEAANDAETLFRL